MKREGICFPGDRATGAALMAIPKHATKEGEGISAAMINERTPFNVGFSLSPLFIPALNCFCRRNLECVAVCRSSSYCELTAPLDNAQGLGDDYGSMAWKTYRECQNFGLVLASKGNRVKWRLVIRAGGASKFVTNTDCRILLSLII